MWNKASGCLRVAGAWAELKVLGFRRSCANLLAPFPNKGYTRSRLTLAQAHSMHTALAASARFPFSTCLTRSMVLCRSLRRRHMDARLVLGTRTGQQGFLAHAWVEVEGHPIGDTAGNTPFEVSNELQTGR